MSAAGTKQKPAKKRGTVAAPRAVEVIKTDLQFVNDALEEANIYDEKYDKLKDQRRALLDELEIATTATMPAIDPLPLATITEHVPLDLVKLNGNHREQHGEPASDPKLLRIARSMEFIGGLLHPIGLVRPPKGKDEKYRLIWGSRRVRAAVFNQWKNIEAKIYPSDISEDQIEILRTIENFERDDLNPVEEAIAVARVLDTIEKITKGKGSDFDEHQQKIFKEIEAAGGPFPYVGLMLGRPEKWVRDHSYVQRIGGESRKLLSAKRISIDHARELAKLGDPEAADALARDVARSVDGLGGKDVEYLRQRVEEYTRSLARVPWKLEVAFGKDEKAGCMGWACLTCPFNTRSDPVLFGTPIVAKVSEAAAGEDVEGEPEEVTGAAAGTCTNARCFDVKVKAADRIIANGIEKARKAVKKDSLPITAKALAHVIPLTIRGSAFINRARKVVAPETGKVPSDAKDRDEAGNKTTRSTSSSGSSSAPVQTPEQKARATWRQAVNAWSERASLKIITAIEKKPGAKAFYILLNNIGTFQKLSEKNYGTEAEMNAANAKTSRIATNILKPLAKKMAAPLLRDFIAQEKNTPAIHRYAISSMVPTALEIMAEALGAAVGEPPVLELPKVAKAADMKPADVKTSKKAIKRAVKKAKKAMRAAAKATGRRGMIKSR